MLLSNCFYTFSEITQQINYLEFSVIKELVLAFLNNLISDNVRANNLLVNEIIKLEKKSLQIF